MCNRLWIDTELYSPIDLKVVGAYRYVLDPGTEVMLVTYAIDGGPVQCWDLTERQPVPSELRVALTNAREVWAHNAQFDRIVLREKLKARLPIERWRCTMVQAMEHGLPAGLGALCHALDLPEDDRKHAEGKALITKFCRPDARSGRTQPWQASADWHRFREYAKQDVAAMRECQRRMPSANYPRAVELAYWHMDQRMNDRGLPMDRELAAIAGRLTREAIADLDDRMRKLTGGAVGACSEVTQLKKWIIAQGIDLPDGLDRAAIEELLDQVLPQHVREALLLRSSASKTSTAKFAAITGAINSDDRIRGTLTFYGASRTGRWSGRVFQPQNLPRGSRGIDPDEAITAIQGQIVDMIYPSPLDALSTAIRGTIKAPRGYRLVCSDLAAIEGRVLAWIADETWKIEAYARDEDLYILAYARAFGVPAEEVTKALRQVGKVLELALGYQGGVGALQTMAAGYGLDLPPVEEQQQWVWSWRDSNQEIQAFWGELEAAAKRALLEPGSVQTVGRLRIALRRFGHLFWLMIRLPSGRYLTYFAPRLSVVVEERTDKKTGETYKIEREVISFIDYKGVRAWRNTTYGGKLTENVVQAISRDILAAAMARTEEFGIDIITSIHDEIVCEVPITSPVTHERLSEILATPPEWADGLPLAAKGFESIRYRKD